VGLLLGGALTEYLSWRWVLFINVPIAALVLIGTGVLVPGDNERGALDVAGAATRPGGHRGRDDHLRQRTGLVPGGADTITSRNTGLEARLGR
jgi:MFS family permease